MSTVTSPVAERLLSREEAAEYLGVKSQTLAIWLCTRRYDLPVVKIGRLAKYRRADLDAFIRRRTVGGNSKRARTAAEAGGQGE